MAQFLLSALINPSLWGINIWAFQAVNGIASQWLNSFMVPFAESFFIVLPVLAIYLIWKKDTNVYAYLVAAVGLFALGEALKYLFQVPRPCQLPQLSWINQPTCETGFSFPSEHAMTLTGLFLFFGKYRVVQFLYIIWMLIILFGRVYLGQHYLTDVIVGAAISLIITFVIYHYRSSVYRLAQRLRLDILTPKTRG